MSKPNLIAVTTPLTVARGMPHGSSNEGAKDGHLAQPIVQPPAVASTPTPAMRPGGAPFVLREGKR